MDAPTISHAEIILRLAATFVLCGAVGFEREVRDQPAGFRTHIILGLGSALFTMVSAYGFQEFFGEKTVRFDPSRIAAQIVSGIGFLGAGAILRQGVTVRGLTTAASLWTTAAIGMAVGAGYLFGATAATVGVLAALLALRRFRSAFISRLRLEVSDLEVSFSRPDADPSPLISILEAHHATVRTLDAEIEGGRATYHLQVRVRPPHDLHAALGEIARQSGVERVAATGLRDLE
ncbi:MgtC/SapB family protein [Rubrobacter calidifluminis]|uniref:MgtC/SapB family protein n=1 Tax=Rubrobacter calidifluminis TaxID=1392640 RepID=UPI0023610E07|nr:MgtC/SapB family protein [Rubrobacter calidifluminis]